MSNGRRPENDLDVCASGHNASAAPPAIARFDQKALVPGPQVMFKLTSSLE
jgi:hypothetical protein